MKKLKTPLSILLVMLLAFVPFTAFAAEEVQTHEQVLKQVYESNIRLSEYGKGKYDVNCFAVANTDPEYAAINQKAKEITADCSTDREKARAINNWIAENIYFDYDNFSHSAPRPSCEATDVFETRVTVCEGYAALMNEMCHAVGVPCRQILGQVVTDTSYFVPYETAPKLNEGGHAWVEIFVDGEWFFCDPTWDSRNQYEYGTKTYHEPVYNYFCMDDEAFSKGHYTIDYYDRVMIDDFAVNPSIYGIKLCGYTGSEKNVVISEELEIDTIHTRAFYENTTIESVSIPSTVSFIGFHAFMNCRKLQSVTFSEGLTETDVLAFANCENLTTVSLPSSLKTIGYGTFSGCKKLKTVYFGNSLKSIGVLAFGDCNSLRNVYYDGTKEEWNAVSIANGNTALGNATVVTNDGTINPSGTPVEDCSCICHKSGISAFFYQIVRLFWRLFKTNQTCECGATHY